MISHAYGYVLKVNTCDEHSRMELKSDRSSGESIIPIDARENKYISSLLSVQVSKLVHNWSRCVDDIFLA